MNAVQLRPYQDRMLNETRLHFREGRRTVLTQLQTGGGKTLQTGTMLGSAAVKLNAGMFICNRIELVDQTCAAFHRLGLDFGIIAAGYSGNPRSMIQVASIDTLKNRVGKLFRPPKLIAWDECRSIAAAGWTRVYDAFPNSKHVGLDATPERLDGKGLGNFFEVMVRGPSYQELMEMGFLVPFEVYAPSVVDLTGVRTKMGDYDKAQLAEIMDKPSVTGDIVHHYLKIAGGLPGLVFAVNVQHSENLAAKFRAAGVRAYHLDGDTPKEERKRIVRMFRRNEIDLLCNVNLFTAGFDVPGVRVVIDAAPSQSVSQVLQRWGRGSRPEDNAAAVVKFGPKDFCILLDHAGNVYTHGLPEQDREWSLEGRPKMSKAAAAESVKVIKCEGCYRPFWPPPECPRCGTAHEPKLSPRQILEREGELRRIEALEAKESKAAARAAAAAAREAAEVVKRANAKELKKAKTLEELEAIGKARGYHKDWAKNTYEARKARAATFRADEQYKAYGQGRWG